MPSDLLFERSQSAAVRGTPSTPNPGPKRVTALRWRLSAAALLQGAPAHCPKEAASRESVARAGVRWALRSVPDRRPPRTDVMRRVLQPRRVNRNHVVAVLFEVEAD